MYAAYTIHTFIFVVFVHFNTFSMFSWHFPYDYGSAWKILFLVSCAVDIYCAKIHTVKASVPYTRTHTYMSRLCVCSLFGQFLCIWNEIFRSIASCVFSIYDMIGHLFWGVNHIGTMARYSIQPRRCLSKKQKTLQQ